MKRAILIGAVVCLAITALGASQAGAVVLQKPGGGFLGVTPRTGVAPAAIGSVRGGGAKSAADTGALSYHGGGVLHSSAPYLIFWDPSSRISSASRALLAQYLTDVAADSGKASNVYAVNRQYTDASGTADYSQTFSAAQVVDDTNAFPTRDLVNCADVSLTYLNCVTDTQIQSELSGVIAANHLPTGTGPGAPIYLVVTPSDTNVCAADGSTPTPCADNSFCAYHSGFANSGSTVLYAAVPLFFNGASAQQDPKACQDDGTGAVQEPNGDSADVAIKYLSHEDAETITDPTGRGWWDSSSGNEDGDNCNFAGANDPANGSNPNAFGPTLGGDASSGTLYDQSINGHHYYTQTEWSNGNLNCEAQPSTGTLSAQFSVSGNSGAGSPLTFDPAASSSSQGFSSVQWDFGDGDGSFAVGAPSSLAHTYAAEGTYTARLTVADGAGNVSTFTKDVSIGSVPNATFSFSPTAPIAHGAVGFDARNSSDPNPGATLTTYSWNFGDGSPAGTGPTPSHSYASPGTYTVRLTVTDSIGLVDTVSRNVSVAADETPTPRLALLTSRPETGLPVSLDGSASSDPDGTIVGTLWSFGDGSPAATGSSAHHAYTRPGSYTVVLTVLDSDGQAASASEVVQVAAPHVSAALHGRSLRVTVDQAGTVIVKGQRKLVADPSTVSFKLALNRSQRRQLRAHRTLKVKLRVRFEPLLGQSVTQVVTVKVGS